MKNMDNSGFDSLWLAAGKKSKERDYWLHKLSGEPLESHFPVLEAPAGSPGTSDDTGSLAFRFSPQISAGLVKLSAGSDSRLHIVLVSLLTILLAKYSGNDDVILGMPVLKSSSAAKLINRVLPIRNRLSDDMTFKELL
ncbi:MAG: condensation domain-containing protein, partial [Candidatus Aminicenantes bacterium]|nr:condensation domain-containing protein [Candidatus Aminicenantes bacterium]